MGATSLQDTYMEFKHEQSKAIARAKQVVIDVGREYGEFTGRHYGLMEEYMLDDAEYVIVSLNSAAGTNKVAVDRLRGEGKKVGLLKPRLFRPFPHQEIASVLAGRKAVAVLDRADSMNGFGAPLFTDIRSALYDSPDKPMIFNRIFGLGGRDYKLNDALGVFDDLFKAGETGEIAELVKYITI
jgi:pyruvate ferredoxin oxidoreductase alpha subunit